MTGAPVIITTIMTGPPKLPVDSFLSHLSGIRPERPRENLEHALMTGAPVINMLMTGAPVIKMLMMTGVPKLFKKWPDQTHFWLNAR